MVDVQAAQLVRNSKKYKNWRSEIERSGCEILSEEILYVLQRNKTSFYTSLIDCTLLTPEKQKINRSLLLRGRGVVVIPLLICDGEITIPMVKQRRIVDGDFSYEFPSGGIDESSDILKVAAQEAWEETGLEVNPKELISLFPRPIKVCESMFDEIVYWYAFKREVSKEYLSSLQGKTTGCAADQEHIYLELKKPSEIYAIGSFQCLVGLQLLQANKLI